MLTAPTLVFAWGNPSRGDDALGPLFVERLEALELVGVDCLTDFQLQVEHALDLVGRSRILFVDASLDAAAPFAVTPLIPERDRSFTSHALSPGAALHAYQGLTGCAPPPAWQLAIRGEAWELGAAPTPAALTHLEVALAWARDWLAAGPEGQGSGQAVVSQPEVLRHA